MAPVVLRGPLSPDEDSWRFDKINIPKRKDKGATDKIFGKQLIFTHEKIILDIAQLPSNRILRADDPSKFILASFGGLRFPNEPIRVTVEYINRMFKNGFFLNGTQYRFYHHSNSQLKSRSCFLREATTDEELDRRIYAMGRFDTIAGAAKRAKRIGLLFSAAEQDFDLSPSFVEDIGDIEDGDVLYSDGCGLIAAKLLKLIARKRKFVFWGDRFTPCVIQIRYHGYKGVLMYHPPLDRPQNGRAISAQFRKSQKKFTLTSGDNTFSVVGYSMPLKFGRLNNDVIVLLSSLGISGDTLLTKQEEYFTLISKSSHDVVKAMELLLANEKYQEAENVFLNGLGKEEMEAVRNAQKRELQGFKKQDTDILKSRILVPKSRLLFGVCDPFGVLQEGEVHVRIRVGRRQLTTLKAIDVIVTRNPCLHPGDILKLRAVEHPQLAHLEECLVFAGAGKYAAPSLSSGGDLDGDQFFVCWDKDLIPESIHESYTYPPVKTNVVPNVTRQDLVKHFTGYNGSGMAQAARLHARWVRSSPDGARSPQCQELNTLYSQSVDGASSRIPEKLLNPPDPQGAPPFILDVLLAKAREFAETFFQSNPLAISTGFSSRAEEVEAQIELILSAKELPISEFRLASLIWKLCETHNLDFERWIGSFNYGALSFSEKHIFVERFGIDLNKHPYIWNSLVRSNILKPQDLRARILDYPLNIQRIYSSREQGAAAFFEYLKIACETSQRRLIIFRIENPIMKDRFSVGVFIRGEIGWEDDPLVNENCVVSAFMPNTGSSYVPFKPCSPGHRVFCGDNNFRLYDKQHGNTFIFLRRAEKKAGFDLTISIALEKINQQVKKQVGLVNKAEVAEVEIHITSPRDRLAEDLFDLRFDHVATKEFIKRFPKNLNHYDKNDIADFEWPEDAHFIKSIFSSSITEATRIMVSLSANELGRIIELAWKYHRADLIFSTFKTMLASGNQEASWDQIIWWMKVVPHLGFCVVKRYIDHPTSHGGVLPECLRSPTLIAIVQSMNELGIASLAALERLAGIVALLSIEDYSHLLNTCVLSIRSLENAKEALLVLHGLREDSTSLNESDRYAHRHLLGISLEQAADTAEECPCDDEGQVLVGGRNQKPLLCRLKTTEAEEPTKIKAQFRLDSDTGVRLWSHIRLVSASPPKKGSGKKVALDGVVSQSGKGELVTELQTIPPPEFEQMDWKLYTAGNVSISDAMRHAIVKLVKEEATACLFHRVITRILTEDLPKPPIKNGEVPDKFNESQRSAILASRDSQLSLIWGPPGTGKTTVIVEILRDCLVGLGEGKKVLVAASTHNAVDNVMERFLQSNEVGRIISKDQILRASTDNSKVNQALLQYTVDARIGGSPTDNDRLKSRAAKRANEAKLVFTTCTGAGLGLLRAINFQTVLIDEASQITEATALIPLVKGCSKAILVGDHVQLRPVVSPLASVMQHEVSLLERLYTAEFLPQNVRKTMLNVQYRFTSTLARFPSEAFYHGELMSHVQDLEAHQRPLKRCAIDWPMRGDEIFPIIFIQCDSEEEEYTRSKWNKGQISAVSSLVKLLTTRQEQGNDEDKQPLPKVAVITPYARQRSELAKALPPAIPATTIDGYQGRESDVIVFTTVRKNAKAELGFLEDMRRINVAWTRARLAFFVVGDRATLTTHELWRKALSDEYCRPLVLPPE